MKTNIVFGIIFGLMLVGGAFAQSSDISVSVSQGELSVNPYEIAIYDILLRNEGTEDNTYNTLVEGIPEGWYSLSHDSITVKAGESKTIYLFITPQPTEEDSYTGKVIVNGASAEFVLNIIKDHEVTILIPSQLTSCLCEEDQAAIIVENIGKHSENLNLVLSGDALDILSVEMESFTLEPNETKQIPVSIESGCEGEEKDFQLGISVESTNSYATAAASTTIKKTKCFDFEIEYPQEVKSCGSIEKTFKITVTNTGIKKDNYEVNIEELGFSDIIELEPGQVQEFEVTFVKEDEGTYEIPFVVSSDTKQEEGSVQFIVEKCFGVDLVLDIYEMTIQAGTGKLTKPSVVNIGTRPSTFDIKSSSTWVAIRPEQVTLSPNETQDIFVYYSPEHGSSGEFEVELSAESENAFDSETVKVNVEEETVSTTLPEETATTEEVPTTEEEPMTATTEEVIITTVEGNVTTTVETNITTTTEEIPEPPEVNITRPTGMAGRVWGKFEDFSSDLSEKVEGFGINKMVLSLIVGFVIALVILAIIYLIVMRG